MKIQVRQGTFETNSSSAHALVIFDGAKIGSFTSVIILESDIKRMEKFCSLEQKLCLIAVMCYFAEQPEIWQGISNRLAKSGVKARPASGSCYEKYVSQSGELLPLPQEKKADIERIRSEYNYSSDEYYAMRDEIFPLINLDDDSVNLYKEALEKDEWIDNLLFDERSYISLEHADDIPSNPIEDYDGPSYLYDIEDVPDGLKMVFMECLC